MGISYQKVDPKLVEALEEASANAMAESNLYEIITTSDVKTMLQLKQRQQMMGCDSGSCLQDLGDILGVQFLAKGMITGLGKKRYNVSFKLIDITKGVVKNRLDRIVEGGREALLLVVKDLSYMLLTGKKRVHTGILLLKVNQKGAAVIVDGKKIGAYPLKKDLILEKGEHTVVVEKDGFITWKGNVTIEPGQQSTVEASLMPKSEIKINVEKSKLDRWAWVVLGLGLAVGGGGTYFGSKADKNYKQYNDANSRDDALRYKDQTQKNAKVANIMLLSAALSGVISAVLFTTDAVFEKAKEQPRESNSVIPNSY